VGHQPRAPTAARYAAQFVLTVWNMSRSWQCGRFNVVNSFTVWDREHRQAFLAWANDPWWR
jgi:hypothetical protein